MPQCLSWRNYAVRSPKHTCLRLGSSRDLISLSYDLSQLECMNDWIAGHGSKAVCGSLGSDPQESAANLHRCCRRWYLPKLFIMLVHGLTWFVKLQLEWWFVTEDLPKEMVAQEQLQKNMMPNLKVLTKDTTHATRRTQIAATHDLSSLIISIINICVARIAARATKCEPLLSQVMREFVTGSKSPAQMLQFRPYFANRFASHVKEEKDWRCNLASNNMYVTCCSSKMTEWLSE